MENISHIQVSIVGFGNVGRSVLNVLLHEAHHAFHLNVIDPSPEISGSVRDLRHSAMLTKYHRIFVNDYERLERAHFIIFCAGSSIPIGHPREYAMMENAGIAKDVFSELSFSNNPMIIALTNPVDVITDCIRGITGLPYQQVVGIGALIDTLRMECQLSWVTKTNPERVSALVVGEHGETMVPIISQTTVDGAPIRDTLDNAIIRDCIYECRRAAHRIKKTQGASYYAAANAAVHVLNTFLKHEDATLNLSVYDPAEDICYSRPHRLQQGKLTALPLYLESDEHEALEESKEKIRSNTSVARECFEMSQARK